VKKFLAGMLVAHLFHKANRIEITQEQEVKLQAAFDKAEERIATGAKKLMFRLIGVK
jgi:hypothetical protein